MRKEKVEELVALYEDRILADDLPLLQAKFEDADDRAYDAIKSAVSITYDPRLTRFLSAVFALVGADRFYIGDYAIGVAKLCLCWITLGAWWVADIVLCFRKMAKKNLAKLLSVLYDSGAVGR